MGIDLQRPINGLMGLIKLWLMYFSVGNIIPKWKTLNTLEMATNIGNLMGFMDSSVSNVKFHGQEQRNNKTD